MLYLRGHSNEKCFKRPEDIIFVVIKFKVYIPIATINGSILSFRHITVRHNGRTVNVIKFPIGQTVSRLLGI